MTDGGMSIGEIFVSLGLDTAAFDGLTGQALASAEKLAEKTAAAMVKAFDTKRAQEQMKLLTSQIQKDGQSIAANYETLRAGLIQLDATRSYLEGKRKTAHNAEMVDVVDLASLRARVAQETDALKAKLDDGAAARRVEIITAEYNFENRMAAERLAADTAAAKLKERQYEKDFAQLVAKEERQTAYNVADIEQKRMFAMEAAKYDAEQIAALIKTDDLLMKQEATRARIIEEQAAAASGTVLGGDLAAMEAAAARVGIDEAARAVRIKAIAEEEAVQIASYKRIGTAATTIGRDITALGSKLTWGLTAPLVAGGVAAIHYSGVIEKAQTSLSRLLGSNNLAGSMIQQLREFSLTTPFKFEGSLEAFRRLTEMGFAAREAIPVMRILGDQVAAVGGKTEMLDRLVLAFGKMSQQGRVTAIDLRSLERAAIPARKILAEGMGISVDELTSRMKKGLIDAATAIPILLGGMAARTAGEMEAVSQTVLGMWENIKEKATMALADIGTAILPLAKAIEVWAFGAMDHVSNMAKDFGKLNGAMQGTVLGMIGIAAATGPAVYIFGNMVTALGATYKGLGYIKEVLVGQGLITATTGAAVAAEGLGLALTVVAVAYAGWELGGVIYSLGEFIGKTWEAVKSSDAASDALDGVSDAIFRVSEYAAKHPIIITILQKIKSALGDAGDTKPGDLWSKAWTAAGFVNTMNPVPALMSGTGHGIDWFTAQFFGQKDMLKGAGETASRIKKLNTDFDPEISGAHFNRAKGVWEGTVGNADKAMLDSDLRNERTAPEPKEEKFKKGYSEKGLTFFRNSLGTAPIVEQKRIDDEEKELVKWAEAMREQNKLLNDMSLIEAGAVPMSNNLATVWLLEKDAVEALNGALSEHERIARSNTVLGDINKPGTTQQILRDMFDPKQLHDPNIDAQKRADAAMKAFGLTNQSEKLTKLRANLEGLAIAVQQGHASVTDFQRGVIELYETRVKAGIALEPWEERDLKRLKKKVDALGDMKRAYQNATREVTTVLNDFGKGVVDILMPKLKKNDGSIDGIPATVVDKFQTAYNSLSAQGYADPKKALMDTITMIQQAGTVADANAIAIRHFGNEAGPEMVRLLRNSGTAASTVAKLVDTAGDAVTRYSQESKKLNQIAALWNELGRSIFRALINTGGKAISDFVTDHMKYLLDSIKDVLYHIPLIGTALDKVFNAGRNTTGAITSGGIKIPGIGGGSGGYGGIPGGSNPLGGAPPVGLPTIPGPDGLPSSIGSGGGSSPVGSIAAMANPITAIITAVSSVVTAISSVIGNFQMAHMNTSLSRIEESTRYLKIYTGEQADSLLNTAHASLEFFGQMAASLHGMVGIHLTGTLTAEQTSDLLDRLINGSYNFYQSSNQTFLSILQTLRQGFAQVSGELHAIAHPGFLKSLLGGGGGGSALGGMLGGGLSLAGSLAGGLPGALGGGLLSSLLPSHGNALLDKIEKSTREMSVTMWQTGAESLQGIAKNTYLATITMNDRLIEMRAAMFDPVTVSLEDINTTLRTTIYDAITNLSISGGGTGDTYNINIDGKSLDSNDSAIQTLVAGARMLKAAGVRGRSI